MSNHPQLGRLQLAVLRVLWEHGESRVTEVREALDESPKPAPTTVATVLTRLRRQELVEARQEGKALVYRAALAEEELERRMARELTERAFSGDASRLVARLIDTEELSSDELTKIRALIDERTKKDRS